MTEELFWGVPVILYLFLAGMGAGATTVSASMLLRGGGGPRGNPTFDTLYYQVALPDGSRIIQAGQDLELPIDVHKFG